MTFSFTCPRCNGTDDYRVERPSYCKVCRRKVPEIGGTTKSISPSSKSKLPSTNIKNLPETSKSEVGKLLGAVAKRVKEDIPEEEKLFKTIDKWRPIVEIAVGMLKGFASAAKERSPMRRNTIAPKLPRGIRPDGSWTLDALKFKNDPQWNKQLNEYQNYLAGDTVPQGLDLYPQDYKKPQKPKTLEELKTDPKYNEENLPIVQDPPVQNPPKMEERKEKFKEEDNVKEGEEDIPMTKGEMLRVVSDEKLLMAINFLGNLDNDMFRVYIDRDPTKTLKKLDTFLNLLPYYKDVIKSTNSDALKDILKTQLPEKFKIMEEQGVLNDWEQAYNRYQSELNGITETSTTKTKSKDKTEHINEKKQANKSNRKKVSSMQKKTRPKK